jgi:hypothetical protein
VRSDITCTLIGMAHFVPIANKFVALFSLNANSLLKSRCIFLLQRYPLCMRLIRPTEFCTYVLTDPGINAGIKLICFMLFVHAIGVRITNSCVTCQAVDLFVLHAADRCRYCCCVTFLIRWPNVYCSNVPIALYYFHR